MHVGLLRLAENKAERLLRLCETVLGLFATCSQTRFVLTLSENGLMV